MEPVDEAGIAEAKFGGFADAGAVWMGVEGEAATCGVERVTGGAQAGLEFVPAGGVSKERGEARAQGREELLIRPVGRPRVLVAGE